MSGSGAKWSPLPLTRTHSPNIHDFDLFGDFQLVVGLMRYADDNHLGTTDELLLGDKGRVLHVLIRAHYLRAFEAKDFDDLIRKRIADVVRLSVESHAQNTYPFSLQFGFAPQLFDHEVGEPFVDRHCHLAQ